MTMSPSFKHCRESKKVWSNHIQNTEVSDCVQEPNLIKLIWTAKTDGQPIKLDQ